MEEFSSDEMAGFEQAAMKPYLKLDTFMKRADWSSAKTVLYVRTADSTDKNWCSGLMILKFRTGVCAVKAELWQCYDGEGIKGLDERWDVGIAVFPNGFNETTVSSLLGYVSESERAINQHAEFMPRLKAFEALFEKYVKKNETAFPEPQQEAAQGAVQAMIDIITK